MSYRDMTKPLVHQIDGKWGFTCCVGSCLPSTGAVRRARRVHPEQWEWHAAMIAAEVHAGISHRIARVTQHPLFPTTNESIWDGGPPW